MAVVMEFLLADVKAGKLVGLSVVRMVDKSEYYMVVKLVALMDWR
jgi:hypothetical protein